MTQQPTITYETWNRSEPPRPLRSRLYALAPIGVGSPQVESLPCYLARLAIAHSVSVSQLIVHEIIPAFHRPQDKAAFLGDSGRRLYGASNLTKELVWILQRLTGQLTLPFLTLLPWGPIMPSKGLSRTYRAWCPACLEQQRQSGQPIYEPLLWVFEQVMLCPYHHQLLRTSCPHCDQVLPWLASYYLPGYCSRCRRWLGVEPDPQAKTPIDLDDPQHQWQLWLVQAIGHLLAAGPNLASLPHSDWLITGLSNYCAQVAAGSVKTFAQTLQKHYVDISLKQLKSWFIAKNRPPFWRLLELCYCLRTEPLTLLTQKTAVREPVPFRSLQFVHRKPPEPTLTHDQLEQILQKIIADDEIPSPSLAAVARRLAYPSGASLQRLFPEKCAMIVGRYRLHQQTAKTKRLRVLTEKIRQATFEVHMQGREPTKLNVGKHLGDPRILLEPEAQTAWQHALAELEE